MQRRDIIGWLRRMETKHWAIHGKSLGIRLFSLPILSRRIACAILDEHSGQGKRQVRLDSPVDVGGPAHEEASLALGLLLFPACVLHVSDDYLAQRLTGPGLLHCH